jgi:hypothetical protein
VRNHTSEDGDFWWPRLTPHSSEKQHAFQQSPGQIRPVSVREHAVHANNANKGSARFRTWPLAMTCRPMFRHVIFEMYSETPSVINVAFKEVFRAVPARLQAKDGQHTASALGCAQDTKTQRQASFPPPRCAVCCCSRMPVRFSWCVNSVACLSYSMPQEELHTEVPESSSTWCYTCCIAY